MMFDDPQVKHAARLYGRMLDYQNADHSALRWDQAVRAVIQGKAAFTANGRLDLWRTGQGRPKGKPGLWLGQLPRHRGRLSVGGRRLYFGKGCAAPG